MKLFGIASVDVATNDDIKLTFSSPTGNGPHSEDEPVDGTSLGTSEPFGLVLVGFCAKHGSGVV